MKVILKETYEAKVSTEKEAMDLVNEERENTDGILDYKSVYKTKKSKGEIVDDWYIVTITRKYTV
jgi:hypothetical protein